MFKKIFTLMFIIASFSFAAFAHAERKYQIKEMTPEVRSALDNRKSRFDQLRALKHSGSLGENNHGYVEVLQHDGGADAVASAENQDRRVIYQTIAQQNGLDNAIGTIEEVFAEVQRNKADSGDKVQNPDGSWVSK